MVVLLSPLGNRYQQVEQRADAACVFWGFSGLDGASKRINTMVLDVLLSAPESGFGGSGGQTLARPAYAMSVLFFWGEIDFCRVVYINRAPSGGCGCCGRFAV